MPSPEKEVSSAPCVVYIAIPQFVGYSLSVGVASPPTTIFPSDWMATDDPLRFPSSVLTRLPSPAKLASSAPPMYRRATAIASCPYRCLDPRWTVPATTILPSSCKATSAAPDHVPPNLIVRLPSPSNESSRVPSGRYLATANPAGQLPDIR